MYQSEKNCYLTLEIIDDTQFVSINVFDQPMTPMYLTRCMVTQAIHLMIFPMDKQWFRIQNAIGWSELYVVDSGWYSWWEPMDHMGRYQMDDIFVAGSIPCRCLQMKGLHHIMVALQYSLCRLLSIQFDDLSIEIYISEQFIC